VGWEFIWSFSSHKRLSLIKMAVIFYRLLNGKRHYQRYHYHLIAFLRRIVNQCSFGPEPWVNPILHEDNDICNLFVSKPLIQLPPLSWIKNNEWSSKNLGNKNQGYCREIIVTMKSPAKFGRAAYKQCIRVLRLPTLSFKLNKLEEMQGN